MNKFICISMLVIIVSVSVLGLRAVADLNDGRVLSVVVALNK